MGIPDMKNRFGWSYPPGAASDPYAPYNLQEIPPQYALARNNAKKILRYFSAQSWGDVYRALYKGTTCGVSVGIACVGAERSFYCDELYKHGASTPVVTVLIGSIVEGVDFGCQTVEVDLTERGTRRTGDIIKRLFAACESVEAEAKYIWNETHGCPKCDIKGEWGHPAINPKCKSCKGKGQIL